MDNVDETHRIIEGRGKRKDVGGSWLEQEDTLQFGGEVPLYSVHEVLPWIKIIVLQDPQLCGQPVWLKRLSSSD